VSESVRSGDDGVGDGRVAGTVSGVLGDGEWSRVSETHRPLVTSGDASECGPSAADHWSGPLPIGELTASAVSATGVMADQQGPTAP